YSEAVGQKPEKVKTDLLNSFDGFEVLGTTPLDRRKSGIKSITIVRLWNEGTDKVNFVIWQGNELIQIFTGSDPFPISRFRKTRVHRFVNFHPFLQGSVSLEFVFGPEHAEEMIVQTSKGPVSSWR
ncbi:hypothetical protein L0244_22770, partial [bacterium]|nr:hypothetical protein [bacterium]